MNEIHEKAIDILAGTQDGNRLSPPQLWLVEGAVNGFLNDDGYKALDDLHKQVTGGRFRTPWFHDIEHLTIDHGGSVCWKGYEVEQYTLSWAYSDEAKQQAHELARRCRILEAHDITPSIKTAVFDWNKYATIGLKSSETEGVR